MNGLLRIHAIVETMTRIDAEEVTLMTVMWVFIFPVVEPLLQITFFANFVRMQAF